MQEIEAKPHIRGLRGGRAAERRHPGDIKHNVTSAADGTNVMALRVGEVAGATTETRSSAEDALTAAQTAEAAAAALRSEIEGFLARVAA